MRTSNDIHGAVGLILIVIAFLIVIFLGPTILDNGLQFAFLLTVSVFLLLRGCLLIKFYFVGQHLYYNLTDINRPFIVKKIIDDDENFVKIDVEESGISFVRFLDNHGRKINVSEIVVGNRYIYYNDELLLI